MRLGLSLGGIKTGAFQHYVYADFSPGEVFSVLLGIDFNLFAVHYYGGFLGLYCIRLGISALRRIIFEKMRKHFGIGKVIDSHDFVALGAEHLTESQTSDTSSCASRLLKYAVLSVTIATM